MCASLAVFKWVVTPSDDFQETELERPDPFETGEVRILAVTWNLAGRKPAKEQMETLLLPKNVHHDIYVIGSQEALSSIMGSVFAPSKEKMNALVQDVLGEDYVMVSSVSLQASHLVVFANIKLAPLLSDITTDSVATGFKNMMGNKGAVMVSLTFLD